MKNFGELQYSVSLPKLVLYSDRLVLTSSIKRNTGNKDKVLLYTATFIDKLNTVYSCANTIVLSNNLYSNFEISIDYRQKPISRDLRLILEFLSEAGHRSEVEYLYSNPEIVSLVDVRKYDMNDGEKTIFLQKTSKNNDDNVKVINTRPVAKIPVATVASAPSFSSTNSIVPEMEKYIEALKKEKYYLIHEGGRKYKVSNGKLIGSSKGVFSYAFDLETELYIADDAPISLVVGNDNPVSGTVLMCEDFKIIVLLDKNIGEKIPSARINVEPWKLLEALENRLTCEARIGNKISQTLFGNGPKLATKEPIEKIEKGHDVVIRRAKEDPITIVWGPPGTGKTHTMSEIAIGFLKEGKNTLIVSHSNVSVDGVAKKIYELLNDNDESDLYKSGQIMRYGYIRDEELNQNEYISSFKHAIKKSPVLDAKLEELQKQYIEIKKTSGIVSQKIVEIHREISRIRGLIRDEEQRIVSKAQIVTTTISKVVIDKLFEDKTYDVVMFDEVSMAYVPQIAAAATFAKEHFICVGDFMQLAPIAQSSAKTVLCEDIFSCLGINVNGTPYYHPWLVMLDEQRRMHPRISLFANKNVYKNLLKDHESVFTKKDYIVNAAPFVGEPVNYIDLSGTYCASSKNQDNSRFNILSAIISFAIAIKAEKNMELDTEQDSSVSVITPYAAQTRLIRALIQDYREYNKTHIRCATVHQFQGSESNVVVFDAVESYPGDKVGFLMGKDMNSIMRLINVAVTRAKGKLITVGNARFWENGFRQKSNHTFYKLQKYSIENGNHVCHKDRTLEDHIESFDLGKLAKLYLNIEDYIEDLLHDIQKAKGKIVFSLPSGKLETGLASQTIKLLIEAKIRGVKVLIKTNDYQSLPESWKELAWGTDNAVFPIVMIDDRIIWYDAPDAEWKFVLDKQTTLGTVSRVTCRINGEYTAEMIKSLSNFEYRETAGGVSPLVEKDNKVKEIKTDRGNGAVGLAAYIEEIKKCPICKSTMRMQRGKSGKFYISCKDKKCDGHYPYLDIGDVNHYICVNHVRCPKCDGDIEAKTGQFGFYIKCFSCGTAIKPDEI